MIKTSYKYLLYIKYNALNRMKYVIYINNNNILYVIYSLFPYFIKHTARENHWRELEAKGKGLCFSLLFVSSRSSS